MWLHKCNPEWTSAEKNVGKDDNFFTFFSILFLFLVYVMKIHQSVLSFGENIPENAMRNIQQA